MRDRTPALWRGVVEPLQNTQAYGSTSSYILVRSLTFVKSVEKRLVRVEAEMLIRKGTQTPAKIRREKHQARVYLLQWLYKEKIKLNIKEIYCHKLRTLMKQVECVIPLEYLNCIFSSGTHCTVEPLCTDTSLIRTPLYYGQFPVSRQNSHMFSFNTTAIIWTLSNTDNGH